MPETKGDISSKHIKCVSTTLTLYLLGLNHHNIISSFHNPVSSIHPVHKCTDVGHLLEHGQYPRGHCSEESWLSLTTGLRLLTLLSHAGIFTGLILCRSCSLVIVPGSPWIQCPCGVWKTLFHSSPRCIGSDSSHPLCSVFWGVRVWAHACAHVCLCPI